MVVFPDSAKWLLFRRAVFIIRQKMFFVCQGALTYRVGEVLKKWRKYRLVRADSLFQRGDAVLDGKFNQGRDVGDVQLFHEPTAVGFNSFY
jgi:hypothetical protein